MASGEDARRDEAGRRSVTQHGDLLLDGEIAEDGGGE